MRISNVPSTATTSCLGYEAVASLVALSDTDSVFAMIGEGNVTWIADGVKRDAFRFIRTRHEATAVSAAAGYSRTTGHVGIVSVTRGPGFANAVNALKAAVHDHIPLVLIVAESPPSQVNISSTYHNLNQKAITETLGAAFHHVSKPSDLETTFWYALGRAKWNGLPQVLSIADGILESSVAQPSTASGAQVRDDTVPDTDSVTAAVDVLAESQFPLILAGQGAVHANCRAELEELAELVGARVGSTLNVNRFFSGHPHDVGVCGHSSPTIIVDLLAEVDAVVTVGASFNPYTTGNGALFQSASIIQVEIDEEQPFRASRPDLGLLCDARAGVRALIEEWKSRELPRRQVKGHTPSRSEIGASIRAVDLGHDPARGLDLREVFAVLDEKLPKDRVVVSDSGRWSATLPSLVDAPDGRSWVISRGYGSIGLGLGNAIGAAATIRDRTIALFCGDGGLMMSSHDIDALRLNGLSLAIFIINDEAYGAEIPYLMPFDLPHHVAQQTLPDICTYAAAFGGRGVVVRTPAELNDLSLHTGGLLMVDIRVDPLVNGRAAL